MTLAGYPVNIMTQRVARNNAFDLLFGNFSAGYCVGEKGGIQMSVSKDLAFLTDEIILRFTHRYLGACTYRTYQGIDAMDVAAFSVTS
jgi:HK97 family phage major capsid protein